MLTLLASRSLAGLVAIASAIVLWLNLAPTTSALSKTPFSTVLSELRSAASLQLKVSKEGQSADVWVRAPGLVRREESPQRYQIAAGSRLWKIDEVENTAVESDSPWFLAPQQQIDLIGLLDLGVTDASKLLDWGNAVRAASGAEVEVVSAWQAPGADLLKERLEESEFNAYRGDALERAEKGLRTILQESSSGPAVMRCHLLAGSARDMIPEFTEDRGFDLVVVGTLGRTGVVGEILGETAELILRGVRCSVLAVSPRHRTPVKPAN